MSIKSIMYVAATIAASLPTKDDWQVKIDEVVDKYHKASELPRKTKKKVRKELLSTYNFYKTMQGYNPFGTND